MDDLRERIVEAIRARADEHMRSIPPEQPGHNYAIGVIKGLREATWIARQTPADPGKRTWAEFWAMGRRAS